MLKGAAEELGYHFSKSRAGILTKENSSAEFTTFVDRDGKLKILTPKSIKKTYRLGKLYH